MAAKTRDAEQLMLKMGVVGLGAIASLSIPSVSWAQVMQPYPVVSYPSQISTENSQSSLPFQPQGVSGQAQDAEYQETVPSLSPVLPNVWGYSTPNSTVPQIPSAEFAIPLDATIRVGQSYDPSDAFTFRPPTESYAGTAAPVIPSFGSPTVPPVQSNLLPVPALPGDETPSSPNSPMAQNGFTLPPPPTVLPQPLVEPPNQPLNQIPILEPPTQQPTAQQPSVGFPATSAESVNQPSLQLQAAYLLLDNESNARGRLTINYPLSPQVLAGGSFEITEGEAFTDSELEGANINELYLAAAPFVDLPNLRFVAGQIDLSSYFDRNSFAKDSLTHFVNPVFQTNPALAATALGSRQGVLMNWNLTDNIRAAGAVFSSDRSISEFDLDGVAAEVGFRLGNAILRGTYASASDGGANDGPAEIFQVNRGDEIFGIQDGDRESSFGANAEIFLPELNLGLFGRYGHYENLDADVTGDTYSFGLNFLDLFMSDDRLGIGYGRGLSNADLRRASNEEIPTVLEVFYDIRLLDNLRLGVTLQQLDEFTETIAGFRLRSNLEVIP